MDERKLDEEATLEKAVYYSDGYFKRAQLRSLSEQIALVYESGAKRLLEVGLGNGFVSSFLKRSGMSVTTMDVNPNLEPDIVASVANLNQYFDSKEFDCLLCCEVLEHLPFDQFEGIVCEMARVTSRHLIISLPLTTRQVLKCGFSFKFLKFKERFLGFRIRLPKRKIYAGHHWELGSSDYCSLGNVVSLLREHFPKVTHQMGERDYYHMFFICEKPDGSGGSTETA